jgi:HlyD family secretion protein
MKRLCRTSILLVLLVHVLAGCAGESSKVDPDTISASGFIEGQAYNLASSSGGRVIEVIVREGDRVSTGDLLVKIDDAMLMSFREQAQAGVDAAQASLQILEERPLDEEVASASAEFDAAQAELDGAEAALDLLIASYDPFDPPYADILAAGSDIAIAEAGLKLSKAKLTQVRAGPLEGEIAAARASLAEAEANLHFVDLQIQDQLLTSPVDGVVSQVLVEAGEIALPGTVLVQIRDPSHLTLTLYVPVVPVAKMDYGDLVEITVDTFPDEVFHGRVLRIADQAQFTPANVQTQEERVKQVIAVDIILEPSGGKLKPGMPADALINAGD